jgi:hypothetical protein
MTGLSILEVQSIRIRLVALTVSRPSPLPLLRQSFYPPNQYTFFFSILVRLTTLRLLIPSATSYGFCVSISATVSAILPTSGD